MDFIIADENRIEQGTLDVAQTIDIDNLELYDFEIEMFVEDVNYKGIKHGAFLFAPGTEYGGRFGKIKSRTKSEKITWSGFTWRGMLEKKIVQPAAGQDYHIVSGDANEILRDLIGDMSPLFVVPDKKSGINIKSYQFDRYTTVRKGMENMLLKYGGKLYIHVEQGEENEPFTVFAECVVAKDYSTEIEYSQDSPFDFTATDKKDGINHLICLGSGDLKDREVIHLYADPDGNISKTQSFFGANEIADVFDYSSAESTADLEKYGIRDFGEKMSYKLFEVEITDGAEYDIGDIIAGKDQNTGLAIVAPICGKIFRMSKDGREEIEYRMKVNE